MKFNESGTFGSGEKITVISAEDAPNHQLHEPKDGEHPVEVKAVVENTTSSPISFNVQNFAMYDNNSELADFDASTYQNNIPNDIAAGMKANITFTFLQKVLDHMLLHSGTACGSNKYPSLVSSSVFDSR